MVVRVNKKMNAVTEKEKSSGRRGLVSLLDNLISRLFQPTLLLIYLPLSRDDVPAYNVETFG